MSNKSFKRSVRVAWRGKYGKCQPGLLYIGDLIMREKSIKFFSANCIFHPCANGHTLAVIRANAVRQAASLIMRDYLPEIFSHVSERE